MFGKIAAFLFPFKAIKNNKYACPNIFFVFGAIAVCSLLYYFLIKNSLPLVGIYTLLFTVLIALCVFAEFFILLLSAKLLKVMHLQKSDIFGVVLLRYLLACFARIVVHFAGYNTLFARGLSCAILAYALLVLVYLMVRKYKLSTQNAALAGTVFIAELLHQIFNLFKDLMILF